MKTQLKHELFRALASARHNMDPKLKKKLLIGGGIFAATIVLFMGLAVYVVFQSGQYLWGKVTSVPISQISTDVSKQVEGFTAQNQESWENAAEALPGKKVLTNELQKQKEQVLQEGKEVLGVGEQTIRDAQKAKQSLFSQACQRDLVSLLNLATWISGPLEQMFTKLKDSCLGAGAASESAAADALI